MILVTVDANMLASGARELPKPTPPINLVAAWKAGQFRIVQSEPLMTEVWNTLNNRYFSKELSEGQRSALMETLRREAAIVPLTTTVQGVATHPEDDLVLATALSGGAQFIVTGDHKLLGLHEYQGVIIVDVRSFLAMLPGLLPSA